MERRLRKWGGGEAREKTDRRPVCAPLSTPLLPPRTFLRLTQPLQGPASGRKLGGDARQRAAAGLEAVQVGLKLGAELRQLGGGQGADVHAAFGEGWGGHVFGRARVGRVGVSAE